MGEWTPFSTDENWADSQWSGGGAPSLENTGAVGAFENGADDESSWIQEAIEAAGGVGAIVGAGVALAGGGGGKPRPASAALIPTDFRIGAEYKAPNLGMGPSISLPFRGTRAPTTGTGGMRAALLNEASMNAGMKLTTKAIIHLLRKFGIPAVIALTKLTAEHLLWLWQSRKKRGSRGPYLRTVVKRVRQANRYRDMLARYSRKAGISATRHPRARPRNPFQSKKRK